MIARFYRGDVSITVEWAFETYADDYTMQDGEGIHCIKFAYPSYCSRCLPKNNSILCELLKDGQDKKLDAPSGQLFALHFKNAFWHDITLVGCDTARDIMCIDGVEQDISHSLCDCYDN